MLEIYWQLGTQIYTHGDLSTPLTLRHQGDFHATQHYPAGLLASPTGHRPLRSPGPLRFPTGDCEIDAGRTNPGGMEDTVVPMASDILLTLPCNLVFYGLLICIHDATHDGE